MNTKLMLLLIFIPFFALSHEVNIEDIALSIENGDSVSLMENFNVMASNCGTCHKKFRN